MVSLRGPQLCLNVRTNFNLIYQQLTNQFRRKQTLEEKQQRLEYEEQCAKMLAYRHSQLAFQNGDSQHVPQNGMNPNFQMNFRGPYEMAGMMEEYSGSSYLSSSSKRQRLNDEAFYNTNGLIPGPQLLISHSVPMMKIGVDKHH